MTQEIVWLSTQETKQDTNDSKLLGGKGNGLLQLTRLSLPVPAGFILTTTFFADSLSHQKEEKVGAAYELLGQQLNELNPAVAVRSSAQAEDGQFHSFAGAYDTFLWVRGLDDLLDKITRCQASLFSTRAREYRAEMEIAGEQTAVPPMAVVVQAMIPAHASGVMMTLNPSNGDRSKITIESTWGLGQLLVDGAINPDRFLVDKITDEIIAQTIAHKTKMLQANEQSQSGTAVTPIPQHLADSPSLTTAEIEALCGYGRLLENHFGIVQDVEFATYQNQIFILQARPETVWAQKQLKVYGLNGRPVDHIVSMLTTFGKNKR